MENLEQNFCAMLSLANGTEQETETVECSNEDGIAPMDV
jgi:hypothetical protein